MKKFYMGFTVFFLIYGILMYHYLFQAPQELPYPYLNGPADPSTFMTDEQLTKATVFSRVKDFLFFIGIPWEWAIYILLLGLGISAGFYSVSKKTSGRSRLVQSGIYVFLITLFVALLQFPLQYYYYKVSSVYGITVQPFNAWILEKGKRFIVDFILTLPMIWILYYVIKKSPKRWWLWFWIISIPFTILLFFVQPVIIDPIFHDFQSLQDQGLKKDILVLAQKAEIPTNQVFQVNMSEKTTAMNAYVTGIGSNARIVLWDTTLQKLNKDEILFIMAHEMGHYVYKHIYWMLAGTILSSFLLFYLIYRLMNGLIKRFGYLWAIEGVGDFRSLPLFLLLLSVLTFAASPIENTISRQAERAADRYGIVMTQNQEAAISAFQKLSVQSLVEPNPPDLVKVFLYAHPTMAERIYTISQFSD